MELVFLPCMIHSTDVGAVDVDSASKKLELEASNQCNRCMLAQIDAKFGLGLCQDVGRVIAPAAQSGATRGWSLVFFVLLALGCVCPRPWRC